MSGRGSIIAWSLALAAVIAGVYWLTLGRRETDAIVIDAQPSSATQPASTPTALTLTKVDGALRVKAPAGTERELKVGDAVSVSDEVLSGAGTSAELSLDGASIAIGAETQVQFRGESGDALQFFITGGNVQASSSGRALEFLAAGTSGRVRVQNAAARLLSDGSRGLVAYSERGQVYVTNAGQTIALDAGQATRLIAEKAPAKSWKIPASMLLKVSWPKESELAVRKLKLGGNVSPGALVRVQSGSATTRALASEHGDFVIELRLDEGANEVVVQSDDARGKHELVKHRIKVDTTPADVGVETSPEMWKKK